MPTTFPKAESPPAPPGSNGKTLEDRPARFVMPAPYRSRSIEPFNWPLFWARSKFWTWTILTKTLVSVVYLPLISRGLQYVFPDIGLRLYKVAGFAMLEHYKATYRITLADVFTVVPLILAWLSWTVNLELFLWPDAFASRFQRSQLQRIKMLVIAMGSIVIVGDACLFAAAFSLASWGGAKLSFASVLAAAFYATVVGFTTFVSLHLADKANSLKKGD